MHWMALWLLNIKNLLLSVQEPSHACLEYINYIQKFYHCSVLVVVAILRLDLVQFVLEVLCEQLVVVFGLFGQIAGGMAEGGAFIGVLFLELRQFRLLLFH